MDQGPLVEDQIKDGQRLIERLDAEGFGVTAASWIKASEDGTWFLYIASPAVDDDERYGGYRRLIDLVRQVPQPFGIDSLEIKLISPRDPITRDVLMARDRHLGKRGVWFRGSRLGELAIEGAYIYPPIRITHPSDAASGVA